MTVEADTERRRRLERTRRELGALAWILDTAFRIPGTNIRFGLEPIVGLIPGVGDVASGAVGAYLVLRAVRFGLPRVVTARMIANTLLDVTIGAVPLLGDAFDFFYKSNTRNARLFEEHASDPTRTTRGSWIFLGALAAIFVGAILAALAAVAWLVSALLGAL
jgi:hypothetical protein